MKKEIVPLIMSSISKGGKSVTPYESPSITPKETPRVQTPEQQEELVDLRVRVVDKAMNYNVDLRVKKSIKLDSSSTSSEEELVDLRVKIDSNV